MLRESMHTRRQLQLVAAEPIGGVALAVCSPTTSVPAPSAAATPAPAPRATPAPTSGAAAATAPATTASTIKRGGQLIYADSADPKSLDPALITNRTGARVLQMIYDPLIDLDANSTLVPALAESWDLSSDAKSLTLHLRGGVKFHDGTTFDAQSVKTHFEGHLNPATNSLRTGELVGIDGVDVDSGTVRIRLKQPNPQFLYFLVDWDAFIESPSALQQYGSNFGQHPVGTGPFKFVEYVQDDHTLLERNADYWDRGKPYVDNSKVRVIPVDETRLTELQAGGTHIAQDAPPQDIQRLSSASTVKPDRRLGGRFSTGSGTIGHSPYADNNQFRQAVKQGTRSSGHPPGQLLRDRQVELRAVPRGDTSRGHFQDMWFA
jgi:peptide/nickel transport system substrate-binding protein